MSVQQSVYAVQSCIRSLNERIDLVIGFHPGPIVERVCRQVLSNPIPPINTMPGVGVCIITGRRCNGCIDINGWATNESASTCVPIDGGCKRKASSAANSDRKKQSKGNQSAPGTRDVTCGLGSSNQMKLSDGSQYDFSTLKDYMGVYSNVSVFRDVPDDSETSSIQQGTPIESDGRSMVVHPKFSYFFLMLWFTGKIDHVVRNHTRCWIERHNQGVMNGSDHRTCPPMRMDEDEDSSNNIQFMCEEFSKQDDLIEGMFTVFNRGYLHVMDSLDLLDSK